jgi:hypothetical protein
MWRSPSAERAPTAEKLVARELVFEMHMVLDTKDGAQ